MSKLENLLPLIEHSALVRAASPKAVKAGQELFKNKAVKDIVVDGDSVRGKVKGTHAVPHTTTLKRKVTRGGKGKKLECHCTCPTFTDGWEKICHHGVALAMELHEQFMSGGELTMTENPWVKDIDAKARKRYQIQQRRGLWQVTEFGAGSAASAARRSKRGVAPGDKLIQHFLDQAIDETDDGAAVLEDVSLAGLLYFARDASVSLKGVGKLNFVAEPLVLRVQAESRPKDHRVELHAFLEHPATERSFEVDQGRIITGAPTWFLWPETAELFLVPGTPPWTLSAVAERPTIVMDSSVAAEDMDQLSESLQAAGVPPRDLFELASDSREISAIVATIEGGAGKISVGLAARYDNVTLAITGEDPESARYSVSIAGEAIAFYRDLEAEGAARRRLLDGKLRWSAADEAFVALGDTAIEFIVAGLPLLPEEWEKKVPKLPKLRSKAPKPRISVKNPGGSVLDVEALVDVEGDTGLISMRDLLRWLHEGRRWVELSDGSVAKLDPKILEPVAEAAGAMQFDKHGMAEVSTLELGTLARLLQEVPDAKVARDVKKLMANMTGERSARAPRKAKALTAKLRDYQKSGFAWLWQLHQNQMAGILADDMGLGKTVQALALLTKAKEADGPGPSLIVGPTSVLGVWRGEVKKWAPSLSVLVWHGVDRSENLRLLKKTDVIVTSYAILRRDIDELSKIRFRYAILDEAQYIKNWTTSTAKAAKRLNAEHRLALSGTPIENHLVDLWAIYDFLAPGFLGKLSEFQKGYVKPIEDGDHKALDTLRARIRPFIMRRRKEDVASELPPKTEQTIFCQFDRSQLALYNRILKAAKSEITTRVGEVGIEKSQMTILAALTRLRQVCTDPKLLNLPEGTTVPKSTKLEAFRALIGEAVGSGRKALVFSQFVSMQKILAGTLEELEIDYLWLHGGTTNRDELVQRFQQKSGPPVFLISLKAGGAGLTLTEADTVIHYDPWWNPAVEDQATDRAHRIGQEKPVMVYRLVVEHTVEQKMVELGAEKRKIAESALGRDTTVGKKLTMEDVDKLLETPVSGAAAWEEV
ncbi:SNF2/helicase domain protein [Plesiocystis pacifica SIR-1]|uniref:SNF2/helicase domain protein n=1 Tax=Plesiocystis pacifica SIR-1 TaxID=391625 RepID=A6G5N5_9BACT|nr:DEAD/DEAH box helicase [Plesiocystis pacifica]EDM78816.1 SNF2/helicase domain protein [Plesiocystis pacifica SIR-1]